MSQSPIMKDSRSVSLCTRSYLTAAASTPPLRLVCLWSVILHDSGRVCQLAGRLRGDVSNLGGLGMMTSMNPAI